MKTQSRGGKEEYRGYDDTEISQYTPENAEYQYYYDLREGYLNILASWQAALTEEIKGRRSLKTGNILRTAKREIFQTPKGLIIKPRQTQARKETLNPTTPDQNEKRVAVVSITESHMPKINYKLSIIELRTGEPGTPLLIDQDGNPVDKVVIRVTDSTLIGELGIHSNNNSGWGKRSNNHHSVKYYSFGRESTLHVKRGETYDTPMVRNTPMADNYATDLFMKLDRLIIGEQPMTTQSAYRIRNLQ